MKTNFEKAFERLILIEGGYSNHPYDPGGKTKYGITESTARAHGYKGEIKDLDLCWAKSIYKKSYWDINRLDDITDSNIQNEIFDTGVNCGTETALKFIQRSCNVLNDIKISVDGQIGPATLKAINYCKFKEDLFNSANIIQGNHYFMLAEKNDKFKVFYKGWIRKRVELLKKGGY